MKVQDLLFAFLLVSLIYIGKSKWFAITGLILLIISIPLFHFWIFFTAQRLIEYAFFLFLISAILLLLKKR